MSKEGEREQRDAKDEHDVFIGVWRSLFYIRYAYQKRSHFELDEMLYDHHRNKINVHGNGRAEEKE